MIKLKAIKKFYFFIFSSFLFGSGDINLATVEDFESVKGISKHTAQEIIKFREENGGIANYNELLKVKGIGKKRLEYLQKEFFIKPVYTVSETGSEITITKNIDNPEYNRHKEEKAYSVSENNSEVNITKLNDSDNTQSENK